MAIRFACANCGKYHRISDQHAGKAGRCKGCGHRFIAPGAPPASPPSAPIFVPAARPNLYPRPPQPRGGAGVAITIGLLVGIIGVLSLIAFRDQIETFAPAAVAALPAKVPARRPAPPAVAALPAPAPSLDGHWWDDPPLWLQFAYSVAMIFGGMIAPVLVPPILSRRGLLTVGRWLIMAATIGILAFGYTMLLLAFRSKLDLVGIFATLFLCSLAMPFYFAFVGCFLAAAIHPKP